MKKIFQLLAIVMLWGVFASAQTTIINGTVKDLSGAAVTSGQVTFTLRPGLDTTISGSARYVPSTITCTLTGAGAVKALDGVSNCVVTNNTSLSPGGTYYLVCIQPSFIAPGSCFNFYALGVTTDISTVVPTPTTSPAYNFVDLHSAQTVDGNKTFTGNVSFTGTQTFGAIVGSSLNLASTGTLSTTAQSGTGSLCMTTSCVMTTPNIGVATATSVNKVAITAPAASATLTIANGKTLTANNSLTLAGTDTTTMTFPSTSATIARTDAANTFTGHQTIEGVTSTGATGTGKFVFDTAPTLNSAVANGTLNGSAIHAQRIGSLSVSAAGASQGQQFTTTQTISQSMVDTNFRCTASLAGVSAGSPFVISCVPASATSVTVTMANGSAVQSTVTAIDIIAVHD